MLISMEDVESLRAGYIGALFGIEFYSGEYLYIAGCQFNHDFDVCSQTGHFAGDCSQRQQIAGGDGQGPEPICQGRSDIQNVC